MAGEEGGLSNLEVRQPQEDRSVSQTREKRTDRSPHLPARRVCWPPVGEHWGGGDGGGGRAPPAAPHPYLRPPHSAHSFARVGVFASKAQRFVRPPPSKSHPFPCRGSSPPPPDFSSWYLVLPKEGRPGRETLSPPALSDQRREAAGCGRAGLALRNSGGLCSPQLFPDHLTRQLLGKCCC